VLFFKYVNESKYLGVAQPRDNKQATVTDIVCAAAAAAVVWVREQIVRLHGALHGNRSHGKCCARRTLRQPHSATIGTSSARARLQVSSTTHLRARHR